MTDLERRLAELGATWAAPTTPDLSGAVANELRRRRAPRSRPRRVLVALAASALVIGALAAIAPARNAILDFFDIGGVRIETTTRPPAPTTPTETTATTTSLSPTATPVSLKQAQAGAGFMLRVPATPGTPDRVEIGAPFGEPVVEFFWTDVPDLSTGTLRMTQLSGQLVLGKSVDPSRTVVEEVDVAGAPGVWLTGGPHSIGYLDRAAEFQIDTLRSAGDVLVWERDGVTVRIEGAASLAAALRVAGSLR